VFQGIQVFKKMSFGPTHAPRWEYFNAGANKPHYKIFTIIGNAITISEDTGADP